MVWTPLEIPLRREPRSPERMRSRKSWSAPDSPSAPSPDGKELYVCASDDNLVRVFDPETMQETHTLPSGPDPEEVRARMTAMEDHGQTPTGLVEDAIVIAGATAIIAGVSRDAI